jgi:hypothetical protein
MAASSGLILAERSPDDCDGSALEVLQQLVNSAIGFNSIGGSPMFEGEGPLSNSAPVDVGYAI